MAMESIEPAALTAASLLAASTADAQRGQVGTSAWSGQAPLAELIRRATAEHDVAAVLDAVTTRPQDPETVGVLAQVLAVLAAQDSSFAGELARLVGDAEHDPSSGRLATTIAGHARVGKLVTIGHAGTIQVHLPLPGAQSVLDRLHRAPAGGPVVANLPFRNPAFTGRAEVLDQLHQRLHPGQAAAVVQVQAQAVHGLGGVGKTQLALEYAHRHAGDYDLIWWVTAEQPATIPGQLVALARRLGIPETTDQAETVQTLGDELRGRDRWLLVFDNAEDPADLRPWWPPGCGQVLVTSRNPHWQPLAAPVLVNLFPRPDAITFLHRRADLDNHDADTLAEAVGDLPLALEQAAGYLEATSTRPSEYVRLLRERAAELFTLGKPFNYEQTIATTWSVSLERVREQTPVSEDLLRLCSFLAPDDIPRGMFVDHPDALPVRLQAAVRDQISYQQALGALTRYSLITATVDNVSVHRLVQAVVRSGLDHHDRRHWAEAAVGLVLTAFPSQSDDVNAWPTVARLLPHALVAAEHAVALNAKPKATTTLLNATAGYLWSRGESQQARPLVEQALAIDQARLGLSHPRVASTLDKLGIVLDDLGDLAGARAAHERAVAIYEDTYGRESLGVARALDNLGGVLSGLGRLPEARAAHERGLSIFQVKLRSDHPEVAHALNNLANVVHDQGDLDTARALHERAISIREARLGLDHPDTAQSLSNLAAVLHDEGELDTARALHERALAVYEARLGADHPTTARSRELLAAVMEELETQ